jgi:hypothetical protein
VADDDAEVDRPPVTPSWWWFVLIVLAYAALVFTSFRVGTPTHLPGIALGSKQLLHLERAAAALAAFSAVAIFGWLTRLGRLPSQLGNIVGYPAADGTAERVGGRVRDLATRMAQAEERDDRRFDALEQFKVRSDNINEAIRLQLEALEARVDAL